MKKIKVAKVVVLILMVAFLMTNIKIPRISKTPFDTVCKETVENVDLKEFDKMNNQSIKRFLKLNPQDYENIIFYRFNDPMRADEIVIVKFKSTEQATEFEKSIEGRIDSQRQIYDGYAPKEADLLKKSIVDVQGNYAIYVTNADAKKIDRQFVESLK